MTARQAVTIAIATAAFAACGSTGQTGSKAPAPSDLQTLKWHTLGTDKPGTLPPVFTCGTTYRVESLGRIVELRTCSSKITSQWLVTVPSGSVFTITSTLDPSGQSAYPAPTPTDGNVQLVRIAGPTATYVATSAGRSELVARSATECPQQSPDNCIALTVDVQ